MASTSGSGALTRVFEESDIYVSLEYFSSLGSRVNEGVNVEAAVNNRQKVDHTKVPYDPTRSQIFYVRIPSIMYCITSESKSNTKFVEVRNFLENECRNQIPAHVLLKYRSNAKENIAQLIVVGTWWEDPKVRDPEDKNYRARYIAEDTHIPISCVYPCYRRGPSHLNLSKFEVGNPLDLQMVFGICFVPQLPVGKHRTYGRRYIDDHQNPRAFDITSQMFDPSLVDQNHENYGNTALFPLQDMKKPLESLDKNGRREFCVAFYLCQGAKLVLTDFRHLRSIVNQVPDYEIETGNHCRSLCQQGSLVIVRGEGLFRFNIKVPVQGRNVSYRNPFSLFMDKHVLNGRDAICDSEEIAKDSLSNGERVRNLRDKVIFLGGPESPHSSACWTLKIRENTTHHYDHVADLFAPDSGFFVDVAPWKMGFELINARQRYERPYESVVFGDQINADPSLAFQVPAEYLLERILGLNEKNHSFVVEAPYDLYKIERTNLNRSFGGLDVRRYYFEQAFNANDLMLRFVEHPIGTAPNIQQYTNVTEHRYPPFPLYPPYLDPDDPTKLYYLWNNEIVESVRDENRNFGKYFRISGSTVSANQTFLLKCTKDGEGYLPHVPAYYWTKATEPYDKTKKDSYRIGNDYWIYYKQPAAGKQMTNAKSLYLYPVKDDKKRKRDSEDSESKRKKPKESLVKKGSKEDAGKGKASRKTSH